MFLHFNIDLYARTVEAEALVCISHRKEVTYPFYEKFLK